MCNKVDCENVVISYFSKSDHKDISFKDLNVIRKRIEEIDKSVFVDVSYSAIRRTALKFQEYIEIEQYKIHLIKNDFPNNKNINLNSNYIDVIDQIIKANSQD